MSMTEPKPIASLSPSLLARKGAARPAMRPQFSPLAGALPDTHSAASVDDLGWNDLGWDDLGEEPQVIAAEVAAPVASAPIPAVVHQQREVAARIGAIAISAAATPVPRSAPENSRRSALAQGRRAAFTLRLDTDRHLKLRLACTVENRSAQRLLIEALDRLLTDLPEITALASHVGTRARR